MDAPSLRAIFDASYLLAMAAWVGSVLFFSFGVAPMLLRLRDPGAAARLARALFPRYYAWGATCGAIALPASLGAPLSVPEYRGVWVAVQSGLILMCILAMLYAGQSLEPAINAARDTGPGDQARLDRLRRRGVRLNAVVMLTLIGLLVAFAFRPAPRTAGALEPSPRDRAARASEAYWQRQAAPGDSRASRSARILPDSPEPAR
jgi:hypothetical protein